MQHTIIGIIIAILCLPLSARALTLEGNLTQGGMAIGKTDPGTTVVYQGKTVRVSPEGLFVIGFGRDAGLASVVELQRPSGTIEKRPITIEKRTYKIQRIDGLPPRKVSPSAEDLDRIGKDIALVKKVRKKTTPEPILPGRSSGR